MKGIEAPLVRDMVKGGIWGAAAGTWLWACAVGLLAINQLVIWTWPEIPDLILTFENVLHWLDNRSALGSSVIWVVLASATFVMAILGFVEACFVRAMSLDPDGHARRAICWAFKAAVRPVGVWGFLVSIGLAVIHLTPDDPSLGLVLLFAMAWVWVHLVYFGIFHFGTAASDSGSGWWIPKWPGLHTFVLVVTIWGATFLVKHGLSYVEWVLGWRLPSSLITGLLMLAASVALIFKLSHKDLWNTRSDWLTWRVVGGGILLWWRLFLLLVVIATPAIALIYLFMIRSVPSIERHLANIDQSMPVALQLAVSIARFVAVNCSWILVGTLGPFLALVVARFLVSSIHIRQKEPGVLDQSTVVTLGIG